MKVLYDECIESLRDNKCSECNDFYQCSICDYFQEQYNKGKTDMKNEIEEHSVFYSNKPIEDIVLEARNDAIDKCIDTLYEVTSQTIDQKLDMVFVNALEQLKEKNNDNR